MEITIAYLGTAKRFQEFIRSEQEKYPNAIARGKAYLGVFFLKKDDIEIRYILCSDCEKVRGLKIHFLFMSLEASTDNFLTEQWKADKNLKALCYQAFMESFGYNGLHPTVELIQDLCERYSKMPVYRKAYEEYYE